MGTRHLIAVQLDNEYKIAQYGQFDGYFEGAGVKVTDFVRTMDRPRFEAALRKTRFIQPEDEEAILKSLKWYSDKCKTFDDLTNGQYEQLLQTYTQFSRDLSTGVLEYVQNSDGVLLHNSIDFANDSLFCEFAYVIDLDKNVFEVYLGFNKRRISRGRFKTPKDLQPCFDDTYYHPVKLKFSSPIDNLPPDYKILHIVRDFTEEKYNSRDTTIPTL